MGALEVAKHWLFLLVAGVAVGAGIFGYLEHRSYETAEGRYTACRNGVASAKLKARNEQKRLDAQALRQKTVLAARAQSQAKAARADLARAQVLNDHLTQEYRHAYDHSSRAAVKCADSRPPLGVQLAAAAALRAAVGEGNGVPVPAPHEGSAAGVPVPASVGHGAPSRPGGGSG